MGCINSRHEEATKRSGLPSDLQQHHGSSAHAAAASPYALPSPTTAPTSTASGMQAAAGSSGPAQQQNGFPHPQMPAFQRWVYQVASPATATAASPLPGTTYQPAPATPTQNTYSHNLLPINPPLSIQASPGLSASVLSSLGLSPTPYDSQPPPSVQQPVLSPHDVLQLAQSVVDAHFTQPATPMSYPGKQQQPSQRQGKAASQPATPRCHSRGRGKDGAVTPGTAGCTAHVVEFGSCLATTSYSSFAAGTEAASACGCDACCSVDAKAVERIASTATCNSMRHHSCHSACATLPYPASPAAVTAVSEPGMASPVTAVNAGRGGDPMHGWSPADLVLTIAALAMSESGGSAASQKHAPARGCTCSPAVAAAATACESMSDQSVGICQVSTTLAHHLSQQHGFTVYGIAPSCDKLSQPAASLYFCAAYCTVYRQAQGDQGSEEGLVQAYCTCSLAGLQPQPCKLSQVSPHTSCDSDSSFSLHGCDRAGWGTAANRCRFCATARWRRYCRAAQQLSRLSQVLSQQQAAAAVAAASSSVSSRRPSSSQPEQCAAVTMHVVGPGETLHGIARVVGVSWEQLAAVNPELEGSWEVQPNDCIALPVTHVLPRLHAVQEGDTLAAIALQYNVPLDRLALHNPDLFSHMPVLWSHLSGTHGGQHAAAAGSGPAVHPGVLWACGSWPLELGWVLAVPGLHGEQPPPGLPASFTPAIVHPPTTSTFAARYGLGQPQPRTLPATAAMPAASALPGLHGMMPSGLVMGGGNGAATHAMATPATAGPATGRTLQPALSAPPPRTSLSSATPPWRLSQPGTSHSPAAVTAAAAAASCSSSTGTSGAAPGGSSKPFFMRMWSSPAKPGAPDAGADAGMIGATHLRMGNQRSG